MRILWLDDTGVSRKMSVLRSYEQRCKAGNNMIKAGQNVITQSLVISERDDTPHIFMVSSSSEPIFWM